MTEEGRSLVKQERSLVVDTHKELQPYLPPVDVIEPREVVGNLWSKKLKILGIVIVLMLVTVFVLSVITPRYTSETLVMIEKNTGNIASLESLLSNLSFDKESMANELEILKSPDLVRKVVETLNLYADPEFNANLQAQSKLSEILQLEKYVPEELSSIFASNKDLNEEKKEAIERSETVLKFKKGMSVSRQGESQIIKISYSSTSAEKSAEIVNAIASIYINEKNKARLETTQNATRWLNERVVPLQKKVRQSEAEIERVKQSSGLIESRGATLNSQQIAELSSQLIIADTRYAEAQARLRHVNRLRKTDGAIESIPEVLDSELIKTLRVQEAGLQGKIGELSTELGEQHPTMIQLRAELKDLEARIDTEVTKIISGIKSEAEIARIRRATLQQNLNKLKETDADSNSAKVKLQALEREADADRKLLDTMLSQLKVLTSQNNIDNFQSEARVISYGSVPIEPSFPQKGPVFLLMLFASAVIAMLLVAFTSSSVRVVRSCDEIEMKTGVPSLGYLPKIRKKRPELVISKNPESHFSESIRTLYTSLSLTFTGKKIKTLMVTSAESGEGSTTVAVSLANSRALVGDKVLVVDLNLRKPRVHSIFKMSRSPGVVELLSGDCPIEEVVRSDLESGVHFITAGTACINPADMLMNSNLERMIQLLGKSYDLVIIDASAIMAVPEPRLFLDKVDATLFVVRWAHTKRNIVQKALIDTASSNRLVGVVLNMVNKKEYSRCSSKVPGYHYSRSDRSYVV